MTEGQEEKDSEYRWYCAAVQGLDDCCFEAKDPELLIGEIPHTLKVRRICKLNAAQRETTREYIPSPVPWIALGLGCVDPEQEIVMNGAMVMQIAPATQKFSLLLNELWRDSKKKAQKSNLTLVQSDVPRNLKG